MFGGAGIFRGDLMFALMSDGEVYLKADAQTRPAFEEAGSRPFAYEKGGRSVALSYWLMPDEGLDDPAAAARWGSLALDAAVRAGARKTARGKRR
jgi:DNA transformation protein